MNWIDESSIQRRSLYANGLIVQTDDCKRVEELILEMKAKYPEPILIKKKNKQRNKWIRERWLLLDGWEGLYGILPSPGDEKKWQMKHITDAKKFGGELRTMLPTISSELEKGDTVLVIQNLLLADKHINNALRSWSTSNKLRSGDSTVIVFTEDRSLFPQGVWSKMKIIDVPKSLKHERRKILMESQANYHIKPVLTESELNNFERLLAGMNHDQIDAAIVESFIRYGRADQESIAQTKTELLGKDIEIIQRPEFGFDGIGGFDMLKKLLRKNFILPLKYPKIAERYCTALPRGIIMFGPPGTGKTIFAKAISKELNMSVLLFRPEDVLSKYVGESERALKGLFKTADSMAPCCLFTDEMDRLSKRASSGGTDGGAQVHREIFSMLLEKLGDEKRKWFFIGATNRIEDIDEAMRRTGRIDSIIPVPYPNKKAREEIFKIHAVFRRPLPLANDIDFAVLADDKHTYMWSGSEIERLVFRTAEYVRDNAIDNNDNRKITMDDFEDILKTFNIDVNEHEEQQENIKRLAQKLTNDTRLMDIFEEAQGTNGKTRAEKAREQMGLGSEESDKEADGK